MARPATGKIIDHQGSDGRTYRALRFTAYGKRRYVSLGAVTAGEAERELRHVLADVERGTWTPRAAIEPPAEREPIPTFHVFAEEWWTRNERPDYGRHADGLPMAASDSPTPVLRRDAPRPDHVRRGGALHRREARRRRPSLARSINMTVTLLAAILESAVERKLIDGNPAKGKARRVRERAPARSYLDAAGQIVALLDAAGELDRRRRVGVSHVERRAMIAVLMFAGLRISELCALRWRDVDLAGGWLHVGESKTDAGRRA